MLESMFGLKPKEKRKQLYFYDDDTFEFRELPIEDTILIAKRNGKPEAGFKHYYKLQFHFDGYKNHKGGMVTLGYPRDTILDLFDILTEQDNFTKKDPSKDTLNLSRPWISDIATNAFYKAGEKKSPSLIMNRLEIAMAVAIGLLSLAVILRVLMT